MDNFIRLGVDGGRSRYGDAEARFDEVVAATAQVFEVLIKQSTDKEKVNT